MNCPKCGSSDARKHRIVYEAGTSHGDDHSRSQTPLAERCSPPERPSVGSLPTVAGFIISVYAAVRAGLAYKWIWWVVVTAFATSLAVFMILWFVLFGRRKKARYEKLYDTWGKSWVCMKCGESFVEE